MEIWKEINFGEGNFLVSNLGNIKHKSYQFYKNNKLYSIKEKEIKIHYGKRKYGQVTLCYKGTVKQCYIHVLVATAFIDNPCGKKEVNHIDGNKRNNNVNNLEWATRAENMFHAKENNLLKPVIGGKHHASIKVVAYDYKTNEKLAVFESALIASKFCGSNYSGHILEVCKGKRNYAYGYRWKFYAEEES